MAITATEIVSSFGSYYLNEGQNRNRILNLMFQDLELVKYATPIKTDDTVYRLAKAAINNLVQAFQKAFTEKGGTVFTPNAISLYKMKVDDSLYPDDIEATWLGFLATLPDQERKNWPIVRYLIEALYLPQIKQDLELYEIFNGVRVEPTPSVAGATGAGMNGIRKLLADGYGEGMHDIDLGTLTTSNIFDKVEEFVDAIEELYQGVPMNVFMSKKWHRAYLRDKRSQGFYDMTSDADVRDSIDFTPQNVVGLASMHDSNIIWATPKANLLYLTKKDVNMTRINVEESKRQVFFMTDFWLGLGFGLNELVWTAGVNGSGSGS